MSKSKSKQLKILIAIAASCGLLMGVVCGPAWIGDAKIRRQLDSIVDAERLPGHLVEFRLVEDWPFNSNGWFFRNYWVIETDSPDDLRLFVDNLELPDKYGSLLSTATQLQLKEEVSPNSIAGVAATDVEASALDGDTYILMIYRARSSYWWEMT